MNFQMWRQICTGMDVRREGRRWGKTISKNILQGQSTGFSCKKMEIKIEIVLIEIYKMTIFIISKCLRNSFPGLLQRPKFQITNFFPDPNHGRGILEGTLTTNLTLVFHL